MHKAIPLVGGTRQQDGILWRRNKLEPSGTQFLSPIFYVFKNDPNITAKTPGQSILDGVYRGNNFFGLILFSSVTP